MNRPNFNRTRRSVLVAGILRTAALFAVSPAEAASITWGAAMDISSDSDVSTNGSLVVAGNFGGPAVPSTTINGVTFQPFAVDGSTNSFTVANANFASVNPINAAVTPTSQVLSASYLALLAGAATLQADNLFTLTITGLLVGQNYEFQTWVNNSGRTYFLTRGDLPVQVSDFDGNFVSLYPGDNGVGQGPGGTDLPPAAGQYVTGTFTADATSQQIFYSNGEIDGWVNGFQLRDVTPTGGVPDSGSTLQMLAMAVAGLVLVARTGRVRVAS